MSMSRSATVTANVTSSVTPLITGVSPTAMDWYTDASDLGAVGRVPKWPW